MAVGELFVIIISSMLVSNVVLSQFLGICPFLGVSKKVETAVGMGAAVTFVITIASAITYPIYYFILEPTGLAYLETIAFILIIAALVQFIEMVLKKFMPALHASLGVYLPLITTNCAVLGVALNNVTDYAGESFGIGFLYSVVCLPLLDSWLLSRSWQASVSAMSIMMCRSHFRVHRSFLLQQV